MSVPYTLTDTTLTVVLDCVPHVIPSSHPNFKAVCSSIIANDNEDVIRRLIDIPSAIEEFMQGNVKISNRVVYYKGTELNNYLAQHILRFMEANDPALVKPLVAFLDNVMENPSYRAVQGLFEWVQKSSLPITSDGYLLGWKIVGPDYKDLRTRRIDNSPGSIIELDRNLCDEDPDRTCSAGLHFCSYNYLPHYGTASGNRIVIVKINPRDVVAFPRDYNTSKGRCCRYEVVGEVKRDEVPDFFPDDSLVTNIFDPRPKPEFKAGQRWRNREGDVVSILDVDDESVEVAISDGSSWFFEPDGSFSPPMEDPWDLIEQVVDILPGDIEMKVGQVWETKDGEKVEVIGFDQTSPIHGRTIRFSDDYFVWEKNGDFQAGIAPGDGHILRLVQDV